MKGLPPSCCFFVCFFNEKVFLGFKIFFLPDSYGKLVGGKIFLM